MQQHRVQSSESTSLNFCPWGALMSHICVHRNGGALGPWVTKVSTGSGWLSITPFHNPFVSTLLPGQGLPPPVKTFLSNKPQIFFFSRYIFCQMGIFRRTVWFCSNLSSYLWIWLFPHFSATPEIRFFMTRPFSYSRANATLERCEDSAKVFRAFNWRQQRHSDSSD